MIREPYYVLYTDTIITMVIEFKFFNSNPVKGHYWEIRGSMGFGDCIVGASERMAWQEFSHL